MLGWAMSFLLISMVAALFGFGNLALASAGIAQILFVIFLLLFVGALVMRMRKE